MARLALALAFALLGSACSTTIAVQRPIEADKLTEINSMLEGKDATVTYATAKGAPRSDHASRIALTAEKARWGEPETPQGRTVEVPIDAIRNITLCSASCRIGGALEGAGLGLLAGVVGGLLAASTCSGEYCVFYLFTGPILAVPVGMLVGLRGHRTIIEFEPVAKR
jgi:hypothetical protein